MNPLSRNGKPSDFQSLRQTGHDLASLKKALLCGLPVDAGKPTVVIAHTVKGKGISFVENNLKWHHKNKLNKEELEAMLKELE